MSTASHGDVRSHTRRSTQHASASSSVRLVEYADYECPYCARAYPIIEAVRERLGDRISYEFKNYPLTHMHPHALMAAEAAEGARAQGRFDEMQSALFANQAVLSPQMIEQLAENVGLDLKRFAADWSSHTHLDKIQSDIDDGNEMGVQGTPSFFINDEPFDAELTVEGLTEALTRALSATLESDLDSNSKESDSGPELRT